MAMSDPPLVAVIATAIRVTLSEEVRWHAITIDGQKEGDLASAILASIEDAGYRVLTWRGIVDAYEEMMVD